MSYVTQLTAFVTLGWVLSFSWSRFEKRALRALFFASPLFRLY